MSVSVSVNVIELVLAVEAAKQGAAEVPPASNAGPYVERVLAAVGLEAGDPWCAADVYDTGTIALRAANLTWPLPKTGGCQVLFEYARDRKVTYAVPVRGDLWLRWEEKLKRYAHVGYVLDVSIDQHRIKVQAGNTIRPGSTGDVREGWLNWIRDEPVGSKDAFIRWIELLK